MSNWSSGINSLNTGHTNGFSEGCNNKINVLKRNAYGYRDLPVFKTGFSMFSKIKTTGSTGGLLHPYKGLMLA